MRNVLCCSLPLCVVMGMIMRQSEGCFDESIIDLKNLRNMVGNRRDIKLYSPDPVVTENCQKETLECFKTELYVLEFEYDGSRKTDVTHLIDTLNYTLNHFLPYLNASKGCQHCEIYEEAPAEDFLIRLDTFLQYLNRNMCPRIQQ